MTLDRKGSVEVLRNVVRKGDLKTLRTATALDGRDHWSASAETFLSRVPKPDIVAAWREAGELANVDGAERLKKADSIARATPVLTERRWIPAILRVKA